MNYNIERFLAAQSRDYDRALSEIRRGRKTSHWIWYIFPQLRGLGNSEMSTIYGIDGAGEARQYMENPVLRARLIEITEALLALETNNPESVMSWIDAKKLKSCMTLFEFAAPECDVFGKVLDKYYKGRRDERTLEMLKACRE